LAKKSKQMVHSSSYVYFKPRTQELAGGGFSSRRRIIPLKIQGVKRRFRKTSEEGCATWSVTGEGEGSIMGGGGVGGLGGGVFWLSVGGGGGGGGVCWGVGGGGGYGYR